MLWIPQGENAVTIRSQNRVDPGPESPRPDAGHAVDRAAGRADLDAERVQETARMLRCLGHPVRLRIIDLLEAKDELTVTEIYEALELEQAVCSQHLTLMRDKGILKHRRDGVNVLYRIGDRRVYKVLGCLRGQVS